MFDRRARLHPFFRALVIGLSSACESNEVAPPDATPDASLDVADDATDASSADVADVAIDSYVDWCEAGAPWLVGGDGCNTYVYIPCGPPSSDAIDDAGVFNRCDQFCTGAPDDQCAEVPQVWYDVLIDAGELDAGALTEGGVLVLCACVGASGRRPHGLRNHRARGSTALGAYLAQAAHLEAASVHAFDHLRADLARLGAPRALIDAMDCAKADEARHAKIVSRVARRFGGQVVDACVKPQRRRSVLSLACENAREGCVREAFGALVATWQGENADDVDVRRVMRAIARDEARHTELAFRMAKFFDARLDSRSRARVRSAHRHARREIERDALQNTPHEIAKPLGLPPKNVIRAMLRALDASLWSA